MEHISGRDQGPGVRQSISYQSGVRELPGRIDGPCPTKRVRTDEASWLLAETKPKGRGMELG